MSQSRRDFMKTLGVGTAGAAATLVSLRRQESIAFAAETGVPVDEVINLANNENPMGPGQPVIDAVLKSLGPEGKAPGRYPFASAGPLVEALAAKWNVMLAAGSTQVLVNATQTYTSNSHALVGSLPTYEECFGLASLLGHRTKAVPLTSELTTDLDATYYACKGSGMLFYCNPNNPVASLVDPSEGPDFLERVLKMNKDLRILVDEAYIDYVTTPGHKTMMEFALNEPRLIVARTFSKAYGMAGLRLGYAIAHEDTIKELRKYDMGNSISGVTYAAGLAAVERDMKDPSFVPNEQKRNEEARAFTRKWFHDRGYKDTDAQTNFMFVDVKMPIEDFQRACRAEGLRVGRPFPPLWTHCRISIGTMDEMQRAVKIFDKVLSQAKSQAA